MSLVENDENNKYVSIAEMEGISRVAALLLGLLQVKCLAGGTKSE